MRCELSLGLEQLAPVVVAFEGTLIDEEFLNKLSSGDEVVIHEDLDIELEALVFFDTVVDVLIDACNCSLKLSQIAKDTLNGLIVIICEGTLELPWLLPH